MSEIENEIFGLIEIASKKLKRIEWYPQTPHFKLVFEGGKETEVDGSLSPLLVSKLVELAVLRSKVER